MRGEGIVRQFAARATEALHIFITSAAEWEVPVLSVCVNYTSSRAFNIDKRLPFKAKDLTLRCHYSIYSISWYIARKFCPFFYAKEKTTPLRVGVKFLGGSVEHQLFHFIQESANPIRHPKDCCCFSAARDRSTKLACSCCVWKDRSRFKISIFRNTACMFFFFFSRSTKRKSEILEKGKTREVYPLHQRDHRLLRRDRVL